MLVRISPSADQIRFWAQAALGAFETLDCEDAIAEAKCDLASILAYLDALDAANDPILVPGIEAIVPGIRLEIGRGKAQADNAPDLEHPRDVAL